MADGLVAPALIDPSDLHQVRERTMVNRARHWPRHGDGLVPVSPHVHPQHVEDVVVWKGNPAIVQDGDRRVLFRRLRQELLDPEVVLDATICSPLEQTELVRRRLVAPPGSPIEIVERHIKSPAVLSEDDPHPHDEEHL